MLHISNVTELLVIDCIVKFFWFHLGFSYRNEATNKKLVHKIECEFQNESHTPYCFNIDVQYCWKAFIMKIKVNVYHTNLRTGIAAENALEKIILASCKATELEVRKTTQFGGRTASFARFLSLWQNYDRKLVEAWALLNLLCGQLCIQAPQVVMRMFLSSLLHKYFCPWENKIFWLVIQSKNILETQNVRILHHQQREQTTPFFFQLWSWSIFYLTVCGETPEIWPVN